MFGAVLGDKLPTLLFMEVLRAEAQKQIVMAKSSVLPASSVLPTWFSICFEDVGETGHDNAYLPIDVPQDACMAGQFSEA